MRRAARRAHRARPVTVARTASARASAQCWTACAGSSSPVPRPPGGRSRGTGTPSATRPGRAVQTARGADPPTRWFRNAAPRGRRPTGRAPRADGRGRVRCGCRGPGGGPRRRGGPCGRGGLCGRGPRGRAHLVGGGRVRRGPRGDRPAARRRRLGPRVTRRDREAQHVRERARVVVGDRAAQLCDLRGEHPLGGHEPLERHEAAVVVAVVRPGQDEPVDLLRAEPCLDPDAGLRVRGHRGRHQVVERAVEVVRGQVQDDAGDRLVARDLQRADRAGRPARPGSRGRRRGGEQRELLPRLLVRGVLAGHRPISARATHTGPPRAKRLRPQPAGPSRGPCAPR